MLLYEQILKRTDKDLFFLVFRQSLSVADGSIFDSLKTLIN